MNDGGDRRTPRAKVDIAQREQQIVALKLRGIPTPDIARVIAISRQAVNKAFKKALHRETSKDIQTHHRSELAKLDMEEANVWRAMDANKEDWRAQMSGTAQLRGIHVRRAKLLGLDAPTKLDMRGLYHTGVDEISAERRLARRLSLRNRGLSSRFRRFQPPAQGRSNARG
jgi:DNA-binding CsgD family transcriptional regulator